MTEGQTYRERAAHSLAVALVAWAAGRIILATGLMFSSLAPVATDPNTDPLVERYSTLRGRIPSTGETVGYFGRDEAEPGHQMLARYTLAPLLLAPSDAHHLVLVDLDSDTALAEYVAKVNAQVLTHPRPGLAIVKRPREAP